MTALGTIYYVSTGLGGWVGSEIGHFCLLAVHRDWVGGLENPPKHAYVIFEWSLPGSCCSYTIFKKVMKKYIRNGMQHRHVIQEKRP